MSTVVADEAVLRARVAEAVERAMLPVLVALGRQSGAQAASRGDSLLTAGELAAHLRIDRRTLRRLELEGNFPPPIIIGDRTKRWRRSVIEKWLRTLEQRT